MSGLSIAAPVVEAIGASAARRTGKVALSGTTTESVMTGAGDDQTSHVGGAFVGRTAKVRAAPGCVVRMPSAMMTAAAATNTGQRRREPVAAISSAWMASRASWVVGPVASTTGT